MAQKQYSASQSVKLDNKVVSRAFSIYGDKADILGFTALLEGKVVLKEEVSSVGSNDANVASTAVNLVSKIVASMKDTAGNQLSKYINSYDKAPLIFKGTADNDAIRAKVGLIKMVLGSTTIKPDRVSVNFAGQTA